MFKMQVLQGKIVKLDNVFVDVELYHIEPKQTIKALVIMPLFINATEQEMNIKNGTEVILMGWGADGLNNFLVLGSSNNGIKVGGLGITRIENLKEVKITAPTITISDNAGGRDETNGEDTQADKLYAWVKDLSTKSDTTNIKTNKLTIENEAGNEIVSILLELMGNVIALEGKHGATPTASLKAKLETFK